MTRPTLRLDGHLHTVYSDGEDTLRAIVEAAVHLDLEAIAITDHVRRTTDWLDAYLQELAVLRAEYAGRLQIFSGFEAKVLDLNGNLDAADAWFDRVDVVIGAFHRLPTADGFMRAEDIPLRRDAALEWWFQALRSMLGNPHVRIIGHLAAEFVRFGLPVPDQIVGELVELVAASGKIVEINARNGAPPRSIVDRLISRGVPLIFGSDSHSVRELCAIHLDQGRVLERMLGALLPRAQWISARALGSGSLGA